MRIAFVGKGGSGKTTLSALSCRGLAADGAPVLAVDGDINQHLAEALDPATGPFTAPPLAVHPGEIKDLLRGTNPRIASREAMTRANTATGQDLATQVDPDFVPGPASET